MNKNNGNREEEIAFKKALFSLESIQKAKKKIQDWLNPGTNYFETEHAYHKPKQGFYTESLKINSSSDANGKKRDDSIIYTFYLDLSMLKSMEGIELPDGIQNIDLSGLENAIGLKLSEYLEGDLDLGGLVTAEGLELPKSIGGDLSLNSLRTGEGLNLPKIVHSLALNSLQSASGLKLPQIVGRLWMRDLDSAAELVLPTYIRSFYNKRLTSAEGLKFPEILEGDLYLEGLTSSVGLKLPNVIGGDLILSSLISADGLVFPKSVGCHRSTRPAWGTQLEAAGISDKDTIPHSYIKEAWPEESPGGGTLNLEKITSAEGIKFPESVGSLRLDDLQSAKGLVLPTHIGWDLNLSSLENGKGLKLPKIGGRPRHLKKSHYILIGEVNLRSIKNAKGIDFPDHIDADILLNNLETTEGLVLPQSTSGSLNLNSLCSAEGLKLPQCVPHDIEYQPEVHGEKCFISNFYLNGLKSGTGLILPDDFGGSL
jgi:hypothetical protein